MRVARRAQAAQFAANVLPIIRNMQAAGHASLNAIAGQRNARKVAPQTMGNGGTCWCDKFSIAFSPARKSCSGNDEHEGYMTRQNLTPMWPRRLRKVQEVRKVAALFRPALSASQMRGNQ
jgi:hypothetical protein